MCFKSGICFVGNGYRPAVVKTGYKWSFVMFLEGNKVRCKKVKSKEVGAMLPIGGKKKYTTATLAAQFLSRSRMTGERRTITKHGITLLESARESAC